MICMERVNREMITIWQKKMLGALWNNQTKKKLFTQYIIKEGESGPESLIEAWNFD